ncbi:hypothetical protein [Phycicoccus avicenniae]|uniref:hypothetical protein n=1 Tax=Phycicoccus avicenniae TaxID=2828860 RepID=UPI003D2CDE48
MVVEVGIVLGMAVLAVVVGRVRAHRQRVRMDRSAGQLRDALLPGGAFAVWRFQGPVARAAGRLAIDGDRLRWTAPGAVQPDRDVPVRDVRFRVLRATRWSDVTRVRLQLPGEPARTLRVSREATRPLGPLDAAYENRLEGYLADLVDALRRGGATEDRV